jgi:(-)-germacrene D synthase
MYYEEEHARARMILARLIMLSSLLDDTFDDRATLEECRELNKAIERFLLAFFFLNLHITITSWWWCLVGGGGEIKKDGFLFFFCRWDESDDISLLPECIQKFFLEVMRNFAEFEDELEAHEKYRVAYARKAVRTYSKASIVYYFSSMFHSLISRHTYIYVYPVPAPIQKLSPRGGMVPPGLHTKLR